MIRLRLTHGMSHTNAYVTATWKNPFVTVEDEAAARYCVDSGFFEIVDEEDQKQPTGGNAGAADNQNTDDSDKSETGTDNDGDELDGMTVNQLRAYAENVGIDLGKAVKKADIVAIIREKEAE